MTNKAVDFVEDWISENINAQPYVDEEGDDDRPKEFARECRQAAKAAGISAAEIKKEYPDLEGRMAEAINEAADAAIDAAP